GVHEVADTRPRISLFISPQSAAARRDTTLGRRAHHFCHDQTGAAQSLAAQVYEVEVAGHSVGGDIHVHRRYDHAVRQLQFAAFAIAEAVWLEHGRAHVPVALPDVFKVT